MLNLIRRGALAVAAAGTFARLLFLPGVCTRHPTPDVMRGEEIQVFGSLGDIQTAMLILPGATALGKAITSNDESCLDPALFE